MSSGEIFLRTGGRRPAAPAPPSTPAATPSASPPPPPPPGAARRTLAIAAPSFCVVSETFIRDHVRTVLPGATVVVAEDAAGVAALGVPALGPCPSWEPPATLPARLAAAAGARWRRHARAGLRRPDAARLAAFSAEHRPAALLVEYLDHAASFVAAAAAAGIPLYAHAHGVDVARIERSATWRRHARRLFRAAAGIMAPSRALADRLVAVGCPAEKIAISPCGIDPALFVPAAAEPGRVLAVGRLVEKKAPHLALEAFARAAARFPEAGLDMVGDGPLMGRCRALVAELGLAGRVRLHGALPHAAVAGLMRRSCAFLQHSVTTPSGDAEGLPVAILEAMASALPVVSTRHSGIPEAVAHGESGLLVAEHDVAAMGEAIAALLADPAAARAMGEAGRARVLVRFTQAAAAERLRAAMGFSPDAAG